MVYLMVGILVRLIIKRTLLTNRYQMSIIAHCLELRIKWRGANPRAM